MTTTFQTVANEFLNAFTTDNPRGVWTLKDGSPEWMTDAVREAHSDGRMPDDWIYESCRAMLSSIAEYESAEDLDACEIANDEVDIYTGDLTTWLASNVRNVAACDEAKEEGLYSADSEAGMCALISAGQFVLLSRACGALVDAITTRADERDQESTDE